MGGNKPLHPYKGGSLIGAVLARMWPQARDIAINAGNPDLGGFGLPVLEDDEAFANLGPLSGVRTALIWAQSRNAPAVMTVPCDMPRLPLDLTERLAAVGPVADVVFVKGARDYPLCALWNTALLPDLEAALGSAEGGLAVMRFLDSRQVFRIAAGEDETFLNINQP